jgi:hypothetical protein
MLIVRPEQLAVFQTVADSAFAQSLMDYLRENHSDVVVQLPSGEAGVEEIADDVLSKMVQTGIARARSYGLTWESTITAFVLLMFVAAPNYDKHPLIQRVFKSETEEPNSVMEQLWEETADENWEAVKHDYDVRAWGLEDKEEEE